MSINAISFQSSSVKLNNQERAKSVAFQSEPDIAELIHQKKKTARSFWGSIWASTVGGMVLGAQALIALPLMKKVPNIVSFEGEEAKTIEKALKDTVIESGLKEKGVRIKFLNPSKYINLFNLKNNISTEELSELIEERFIKSGKTLREFWSLLNLDMIRNGNNAAFVQKDVKFMKANFEEFIKVAVDNDKAALKAFEKNQGVFIKANSILAPQGKLQGAVFHEIGHALNANMSRFGKFLQKCRPLSMFAPGLLITYGAFTRKSKSKEEGKELNGLQKTHNFVRDNAGKLALVASLPMLVEEAMATAKGQKFAKKYLSPEMAKKVLKGNMLPYLTYLALAGLGALGAKVAVDIKDKAIAKKELKLEIKAQQKALKV